MTETKTQPTTGEPETQQGFFKRLFAKIDKAMKEKADAQDGKDCCSSGDENDKGKKCC